jgi:folate-binding protein YgfZ
MPNIAHQYRTIVAGAGFRKVSERGRLEFTGDDRIAFLQALVTNDLASLVPGQGTYSALLTPQGRMVTDLHIFLRSDRVICDVPASLAPALCTRFDGLIFAENVDVTDISQALAQYTVIGETAARVVATATGAAFDAVLALGLWEQTDAGDGFVTRTDAARLDSFDVFVPADKEDALVIGIQRSEGVPLLPELAEAIRIDNARPAFGVDMTEDTIPLEAGLLERAISTTKGCYVGQEIVIRVLHRGGGRVARRLVKIGFASGEGLSAGAILSSEAREIGRVTSVADALDRTGVNALGYVHRDSAVVGNSASVAGHPDVAGEILALAN